MPKVRDVICGMIIDSETAAAKEEYEGKTFYFCAPGCASRFRTNPALYSQA